MNIVVTNCYSNQNKGDGAIAVVLLRQLQREFPDSTIAVSSSDTEAFPFGKSIQQIPSLYFEAFFRTTNPLLRFFNAAIVLFPIIVWLLIYKLTNISCLFLLTPKTKVFVENLQNADLVIAVGGGYLVSKGDWKETINLIAQLLPSLIAKTLKKPVVLHSQSIGPFSTRFQRLLTSFVLRKVDRIIVREKISIGILKTLGVMDRNVFQSPDAAFLFTSSKKIMMRRFLQEKGISFKNPVLGVTVKRCLSPKAQTVFEKSIAKWITLVTSTGSEQIVLIPQATATELNDDDRVSLRHIMQMIPRKNQVFLLEEDLTIEEIKSLYENLDYLIANRMHSAIFALTGFVPLIALSYGHKTEGIMQDLGLEDWVIPVSEVNSQSLFTMFKSLKVKRKEYLKTLKKSLPAYLVLARKTVYLIQEVFRLNVRTSILSKNSAKTRIKSRPFRIHFQSKFDLGK